MEVEIPSMQNLIVAEWDTSKVVVVALNHTASPEWLFNYVIEKQITFSMIPHAESIHGSYQIGFPQYGNPLPSYFIINPEGVIEIRIDGQLGIIPELKTEIQQIINRFFP